jgi:hypothetical protein
MKWLNEWKITYTKAKSMGLPEVQIEERPVRDFLLALQDIDAVWASSAQLILADAQLFDIIEKYTQHYRMQSLRQKPENKNDMAFATSSGRISPTFRGQKPTPKYMCGEIHWYGECYFINKDIRRKSWQADKAIEQIVADKLKDPRIQAQVDQALERDKRFRQQNNDKISKSDSSKRTFCT